MTHAAFDIGFRRAQSFRTYHSFTFGGIEEALLGMESDMFCSYVPTTRWLRN